MLRRPPLDDDASTVKLARRLWRDYLRRYWPLLGGALLAMGLYAASASAIPLSVEWITSAFFHDSQRFSATAGEIVYLGPAIIIGLGLANAITQYFQMSLTGAASLSALRDMQRDMYASLLGLDIAQIRADGSGQTISRFTNDPIVLRDALTRAAQGVRDVLTLVGLCAVMIYYDWLLFLIVLVVYPAVGWPILKIGK
ncbi:MAG: ABC transporter transmembrane domain-containing protein, partial [Amphiplicatus sp.]